MDAGRVELQKAFFSRLLDVTKCFLFNSGVASAGTLCNAAAALKNAGAKAVSAYITHGVFSGEAVARVDDSPLENLIVTDSITATAAVTSSKKIKPISIAPLLAEAIVRISQERSVSSLFG